MTQTPSDDEDTEGVDDQTVSTVSNTRAENALTDKLTNTVRMIVGLVFLGAVGWFLITQMQGAFGAGLLDQVIPYVFAVFASLVVTVILDFLIDLTSVFLDADGNPIWKGRIRAGGAAGIFIFLCLIFFFVLSPQKRPKPAIAVTPQILYFTDTSPYPELGTSNAHDVKFVQSMYQSDIRLGAEMSFRDRQSSGSNYNVTQISAELYSQTDSGHRLNPLKSDLVCEGVVKIGEIEFSDAADWKSCGDETRINSVMVSDDIRQINAIFYSNQFRWGELIGFLMSLDSDGKLFVEFEGSADVAGRSQPLKKICEVTKIGFNFMGTEDDAEKYGGLFDARTNEIEVRFEPDEFERIEDVLKFNSVFSMPLSIQCDSDDWSRA